ncbi:hypothetical protein FOZ62_021734, partial [Perkinsus olseni]
VRPAWWCDVASPWLSFTTATAAAAANSCSGSCLSPSSSTTSAESRAAALHAPGCRLFRSGFYDGYQWYQRHVLQ